MSDQEIGQERIQRKLTHVILTRFNLATAGREQKHRNQPNWLATRFDLFEQFCLPSIAAQTCQDFEWIIYFDDATPEEFRSRISAAQRVRNFHAYFTPLFPAEGWRDSVLGVIADRAGSMLLTSTLDNDDCLSRNYVSVLQQAAADQIEGSSCAFNFTNGYVLSRGRLFQHHHKSNAFVNFLEPLTSEIRTCMDFRHMELARQTVVQQIDGHYAWIQVVHGGNVSNRTRGRLVGRKDIAADFPESATSEVIDPTWLEIISDRLVSEPLRTGRDLAAAIIHKARPVGPL